MKAYALGSALALFAAVAAAQAPTESRTPNVRDYDEAQRNVEFTRKYAEEADARLREAEQAAKDAQQAADEARRHEARTRQHLEAARRAASAARASHRQAVDEFERIRKRGR